MPVDASYSPGCLHPQLGEAFYEVVQPAEFPEHRLRYRNGRWAGRVGLQGLTDGEWIDHFARFNPLPDGIGNPLALKYHGDQFGIYNTELGDGRGFLFAQLRDARDGTWLDLGTKGSGRTPWSRGGDGRMTLAGGIREVLAGAMLEAWGVRTSKTLSLVETGETLKRPGSASGQRSAVLVRLGHSHIRIGTFQYARHLGPDAVARLLDHTLATYLPHLHAGTTSARASAFLREASSRIATMGAQWMAIGFVHGVLNTDNINVLGESFDYGPFRFLETFAPDAVGASFDKQGLYAFGRQPDALSWALGRLAESLLDLAPREELQRVLATFPALFERALASAVLQQLGLQSASVDLDAALAREVIGFLSSAPVAITAFYRDWQGGSAGIYRSRDGRDHPAYRSRAIEGVKRVIESFEPLDPGRVATDANERCPDISDSCIDDIISKIISDDDWSSFYYKVEETEKILSYRSIIRC